MTGYPIDWIRSQFPALSGDRIHLDNAAGSQVPSHVLDRMRRALVEHNANIGAAHAASVAITGAKREARAKVASFVGAARPENVVFGPNATTLLTLLADGWRRHLSAGDEVIVTELDHQANVDPWRRLADSGVVVRTWPVRLPEARLDVADLEPLVGRRTRLLAMTAASNALGTRPDVPAAAERVHAAGGRIVVDAVHAAAHAIPDVDALGADMLVFSPYKMFGPHLGVLYMRDPLLDELPHHGLVFMERGDPLTWETGTQNHEAIAGLLGVFDYLDDVAGKLGADATGRRAWSAAYDAFAAHERALIIRLLDGLRTSGAHTLGLDGPDRRTATVSFNVPGRDPRAVAEALASRGIAVSDGHYYAYGLMMGKLGGPAVRASAVHYSSGQDVDRLVDALARFT